MCPTDIRSFSPLVIFPRPIIRLVIRLFVLAPIMGGLSPHAQAVVEARVNTASDPMLAAIPENIRNLVRPIGNPDSSIVVINAQGGPFLSMEDEAIQMLFGKILDRALVVNVEQVQTLYPELFTAAPISFEQAKAYESLSTAILSRVVDAFRAQPGKKIYLVGMSVGAFLQTNLLASYNPAVDGYLLVVGRLAMEEPFWSEFAQGNNFQFLDGIKIAPIIDEMTTDDLSDRNMNRLAAGLGYKRYMDLLAEIDFPPMIYVYGHLDERVGRLTQPEIDFLTSKKVTLFEEPGNHMETMRAVAGRMDALLSLLEEK